MEAGTLVALARRGARRVGHTFHLGARGDGPGSCARARASVVARRLAHAGRLCCPVLLACCAFHGRRSARAPPRVSFCATARRQSSSMAIGSSSPSSRARSSAVTPPRRRTHRPGHLSTRSGGCTNSSVSCSSFTARRLAALVVHAARHGLRSRRAPTPGQPTT